MRLLQITVLLLALIASSLTGFSQIISGKLTDAKTGETLIGVNIFNQENIGTTSDVDGNYSLKLSVGEHKVKFKFIGYKIFEEKFTLKEGEDVKFDIKMETESTTLDLVVVSGSQFEKKLADEMVSVDVVQAYLIENTASPDLKAAISKVPGVTILDGQVSIRGGGGYSYGVGSRVQLVIDDLPLLTGDLKDIQWSVIPMETVEQIEVVKGSSSVLYGSGAMNGVIHVRTGWAKDKPETTFRIYQGLYSAPKNDSARWWDKSRNPVFTGVFFSHRQKVKNFDFVVGVNGSSDNTFRKGGQQQSFRANIKTRYRVPNVKGLIFGMNGNVQYQQHGRFILWADNVEGAYIPLDGTATQDKYAFLNIDPWIQYSGKGTGFHSLKGRYYRVERRNTEWEDPSVSNVMFFDYRFQNQFKYGFNLIAGVQYQYIWSTSSLYPDAGTLVTHNPAIYAQVEKKFKDRLTLLFGLRNETNLVRGLGTEMTWTGKDRVPNDTLSKRGAGVPLIFRGGANFRVAKKTNIRASFGQSYRFASLGEKYLNASLGPIDIRPNNDLLPEQSWSAELGVKQGFRISGWHGNFDVALFWQEYKNMIEYAFVLNPDEESDDPPFFFRPDNVTKARIAGFEIGLQGDGKLGPIPMRVFMGYTFNYPADLQTDTAQNNLGVYMQNLFTSIGSPDSLSKFSILKYRSTNVFKGDVEFDLWKFMVGFTAEYTSFIDRIDAAYAILPGFTEYRELNDRGIWRFDARIAFRISKKSSVSFLAKNFLNEFYSIRPGLMEAPRSFTLQYKLKF